MWRRKARCIGILFVVGTAAAARAQDTAQPPVPPAPPIEVKVGPPPITDGPTPAFSLEAYSLNGALIPAGPVAKLRAQPGDQISCKVFVRDWSPRGEKLRAYQAEMQVEGYTSGTKGFVKPVGYDEFKAAAKDNPSQAYIDDGDPEYVHSGLRIIPLADTLNAPGYRWLTVLLEPEQAPVCKQDGKKFYCGTLHLEVSSDAEGVFTLGFVPDPLTTGLLDLQNQPIQPINYEPLVVTVTPGLVRLNLRGSEPPDGAIDARVPTKGKSSDARSWDTVTFRFSSAADGVSASDFIVNDQSAAPPKIRSVSADGAGVTLQLDRGIRAGAWTAFSYTPTGARVRLAYLPCDVSNDGSADGEDALALVRALNSGASVVDFRTDINRSNRLDSGDLADLVTGLSYGGAAAGFRQKLPPL